MASNPAVVVVCLRLRGCPRWVWRRRREPRGYAHRASHRHCDAPAGERDGDRCTGISHAERNQGGDRDADTYVVSHAERYRYRHEYGDAERNARADGRADRHRNGNFHCFTHTKQQRDPEKNRHGDADCDAHGHRNRITDPQRNRDRHGRPDDHIDAGLIDGRSMR